MGSRIIKNLKYILDSVLQVVYVRDDCCAICGEYIGEDDAEDGCAAEEVLCKRCLSTLKLCDEHIALEKDEISFNCYSAAYYAGAMKDIILRLKYRSDFRCGEYAAEYMKRVIKREKIEFDIVTCVPSTKYALKKRGYNQSEVLARKIAKDLKKPLYICIKKKRDTGDQIGLNGKVRWNNLMNSFIVTCPEKIKNKSVLLVDDVVTTGATVFYCASEMKKLGAEKITILTAAKSKI